MSGRCFGQLRRDRFPKIPDFNMQNPQEATAHE